MLEVVLKRVLQAALQAALRAVLGGGADISAGNPLQVNPSPISKIVLYVLDEESIEPATITPLGDCDDICPGVTTLAITIEAQYNALATAGIKIHVRASPYSEVIGQHTGANGAVMLTDENAHFGGVNELVGLVIHNVNDDSIGVITANTLTTITAALGGGTDNLWDTDDYYFIVGANYDTEDWDVFEPNFAAGAFIRQTKIYESDPFGVKVLVENLDTVQTVTDVKVTATYGSR